MARFNTGTANTRRTQVNRKPDLVTHEGHPAYSKGNREELFQLAVVNFVGQDGYYEKGAQRDERFVQLIRAVAAEENGFPWLVRFTRFLRTKANMRTASLVVAVEGAKAMLDSEYESAWDTERKQHYTNRMLINAALDRADEPGELLGYWESKYGAAPAKVPNGIKKGLADAANRLYDEYATLKYDREGGIRFADVIALAHPTPQGVDQANLFSYLVATRQHVPDVEIPDVLPMLRTRAELYSLPVESRRTLALSDEGHAVLKKAGMTWEALAGWAQTEMDAKMWEAVIPQMGYMALLRNLRNFDQAGVSRSVAKAVAERLADPEQVKRSRQLPYRFWSAYKASQDSDRWKAALNEALDQSLANVPELEGNTLILVDTSHSMTATFSQKSKVTGAEQAALFGAALAAKNGRAELVGFADGSFVHQVRRGQGVLNATNAFLARQGEVGYGTQMTAAIQRHLAGTHDRLVIISDMQAFHPGSSYDSYGYGYGSRANREVMDLVPADVPIYGFDVAGYEGSPIDAKRPNRYQFGGLTDHVFRMLRLIEDGVEQVDALEV
jgi:hypothetical protein